MARGWCINVAPSEGERERKREREKR